MRQLKNFLPAITLTAICLICAILLAVTYELTKGPIAKQEETAAFERMSGIFPDGKTFNPVEIDEDLKNSMTDSGCDCDEIHEALDAEGNVLGYVFVTRSFGYAGNVIVTSGFTPDGSVIQVIATAPEETPKLGKEVEKRSFTDQYKGIATGEYAGSDSGIQMISGATISSKAVSTAFNRAVDAFDMLSEKGVIGS